MEFIIEHNKSEQQFFTVIDGKTSILKYSISSDEKILDLYSTFVPPELRGQYIGDAIALFALNYAKENHLKIIPTCSFIKRIIDRHEEYKQLVK